MSRILPPRAVQHRFPTRSGSAATMLALVLALLSPDSARAARSSDRVRAALDRIYIHGVTGDLARSEAGSDAAADIALLLRDPTLRLRTNAVAFLGHLGGPETAGVLLDFLASPPANSDLPEEYRALLLVPVMLGRRAALGDAAAEAALLELTGSGAAERLARAAGRSQEPARVQADLLESALHSLGHAGTSACLARLNDIASGRMSFAPGLRDPGQTAAKALRAAQSTPPARPALDASLTDNLRGHHDHASVFDPNPRINKHGWTWSNHPGATPVTDARVDQFSAIASDRAGRADFTEDVASCLVFHRSGTAASFGVAGDGLDVIDSDAELWQVLGDTSGRVKVVRAINFCGGPASFWGCAPVPGNTMVVIDGLEAYPYHEAALWVHEYGHDCGIGHNGDGRYFMVGGIDGDERALSPAETAAFHAPPPATGAERTDGGACLDGDGDEVRDDRDNCPGVANPGQEDRDNDGRGDVCDPCPDALGDTCAFLLRNGDATAGSRTEVTAVLVFGDPPLDRVRDLYAPDLTLLSLVRVTGDAGPITAGDPGVLIFYGVVNDSGPLLAVREGSDVVLSGW